MVKKLADRPDDPKQNKAKNFSRTSREAYQCHRGCFVLGNKVEMRLAQRNSLMYAPYSQIV